MVSCGRYRIPWGSRIIEVERGGAKRGKGTRCWIEAHRKPTWSMLGGWGSQKKKKERTLDHAQWGEKKKSKTRLTKEFERVQVARKPVEADFLLKWLQLPDKKEGKNSGGKERLKKTIVKMPGDYQTFMSTQSFIYRERSATERQRKQWETGRREGKWQNGGDACG